MSDFEKFWADKLDPAGFRETVERIKDRAKRGEGLCLLIDGDSYAYKSAAATDGRHYIHPEVEDIEFKYKKDADLYCDEHDLDKSKLTINFRPEPVSHAFYNIDMGMKALAGEYSDEGKLDFVVFTTGSVNFRCEINPKYKEHRADERRPHHLDACKKYLHSDYAGEMEEGLEADDLIGIMAMKLRKLGRDYVIVSNDKDLNCIPGRHYNPWTGEEKVFSETESLLFFYRQVLMGDKVDNVTGIPGCGPKTADKILAEYTEDTSKITPENLYKTVLKAYIEYYEKVPASKKISVSPKFILEWAVNNLRVNAQMLWILQEPYVMWEAPKVTYEMDTEKPKDERKGTSKEKEST